MKSVSSTNDSRRFWFKAFKDGFVSLGQSCIAVDHVLLDSSPV